MKLIQINAWLGRLNGPLARLIEQEQPDFICMQEAYLPNSDCDPALADMYNFLDQVVKAGGFPYVSFAKNWGMNVAGALFDEGNVILSKFPLSEEQSTHIHQKYHIREKNSALRNTRVWQSVIASLPNDKQLALANYQGYLDGPHDTGTAVTIETMSKTVGLTDDLQRPLIFCGDFNIWPSSPAIKELERLNMRNLSLEFDLKTSISEAHRAPKEDRMRALCDYVLVSPEITVKQFRACEEVVSDHKALLLEFEV